MNRKKNGFTLVELLAVIVILGVVLSIGTVSVVSYIENSKEQTNEVSTNSIEDAAVLYAKEYPAGIWKSNKACISIELLVDKGYLTKKQIGDYKAVYLTRDNNTFTIINKEAKSANCSEGG